MERASRKRKGCRLRTVFDGRKRLLLLKSQALSEGGFSTPNSVDLNEFSVNLSKLPQEIKYTILTDVLGGNCTFLAAVHFSRQRYRLLMESQPPSEWVKRFEGGMSVSLYYYFSSCTTWSDLGVQIHPLWMIMSASKGPSMLPVLKSMLRFRVRCEKDPYAWKMIGSRGRKVCFSWPEVLCDTMRFANECFFVASCLLPLISEQDGYNLGDATDQCELWTDAFEAIHSQNGEDELPFNGDIAVKGLRLRPKDLKFDLVRTADNATMIGNYISNDLSVEMKHRRALSPGSAGYITSSISDMKELISSGEFKVIDSIVTNVMLLSALSNPYFENQVRYLRLRSPHVISSAISRYPAQNASAGVFMFGHHFDQCSIAPAQGESQLLYKGKALCAFQRRQASALFRMAVRQRDVETAASLAGLVEKINLDLSYEMLLHCARIGHVEMVRALASNMNLGQHRDAYMISIRHGRPEVAAYFVRECRDKLMKQTSAWQTEFRSFATGFAAIKQGHRRAVETMRKLASLLSTESEHLEALRAASTRGNSDVVKFLLSEVYFKNRKAAMEQAINNLKSFQSSTVHAGLLDDELGEQKNGDEYDDEDWEELTDDTDVLDMLDSEPYNYWKWLEMDNSDGEDD
ncbi:hypothetical protein BJ742DRAFT_9138 [Cladochytrium replicatum]|nr:hypothetical protein BJ742DRAFT_9138 [Cladochytrium replicatum]